MLLIFPVLLPSRFRVLEVPLFHHRVSYYFLFQLWVR